MEWHQLEYFKVVAKTQHFTQAAKILSVSQPALSRSIAKLEGEMGFPLFERCGKNIVLNHYGKLFLRHVERAIQEIENGKHALHAISNPDSGTVSLAFIHSLGSHIVPMLISKFHFLYPNIQFKLYQNHNTLLLEQLETGEIDLCLCFPIATQRNIEWEPLFMEELMVATPASHRLAQRNSIQLTEIATDPLITFKKDYGLRILADQFFQIAGIIPNITFEGEEILTVAGLVESNLGVALIPRIVGIDTTNISFLRVSEPKCCRSIEVAWRKNQYMSPVARKFKDFIIEFYRQERQEIPPLA
ncbi:MAG TPA: LysR family transcriptional regulator [Negativicutes bacterium]